MYELVRHILKAQSALRLVAKSCPNPRVDDYVYFERDPDGEGDIQEKLEGDLIVRPHLSSGLGQPQVRRRPGATRGDTNDPKVACQELGTVLFQIGAQRSVVYDAKKPRDAVDSLQKARIDALGRLEEVERQYGSRLARIIEVFLLTRGEDEMRYVQLCLEHLEDA